jgi:hypothetical protein
LNCDLMGMIWVPFSTPVNNRENGETGCKSARTIWSNAPNPFLINGKVGVDVLIVLNNEARIEQRSATCHLTAPPVMPAMKRSRKRL